MSCARSEGEGLVGEVCLVWSDVQVCHQRKDTTLVVFDLILRPTLSQPQP